MDILKLTWTMPDGTPGSDMSLTNPLARALRQLLRDGKPFDRISSCFFQDDQGVARWLGVFVRSAGDRVIFFPGLAMNADGIQGFRSQEERWKAQPFAFDHLSLESDLRSWHVTSLDSKEHLGSPTTLPLDGGRVLWFGMSISESNALQVVRSETVITAEVPEGDSRRRMDVLFKAREGMAFPMVSLNTDHPGASGTGFLHFSVFVGPTGFEDYLGPEFGFPFGSAFLAAPLPNEIPNLALRSHRLALTDEMDIQITCSRLPGQLNTQVTFTGPTEPGTMSVSPASIQRDHTPPIVNPN